MVENQQIKRNGFEKILHKIEVLGNKLPDITILFLIAFFIVMILSFALSFIDFSYIHPVSHEKIVVKNMFEIHNLTELIVRLGVNFITFPALQLVLVATLGVSIAEGSGYIRALLIKMIGIVPKSIVVPVVILISIFCHIVSDSAYVFLMPIAAAMYYSAGRHPIAGITTSFAALAGGFSASYIPSVVDPLMQEFTQKAARTIDPEISVNVLCNYFLSIFSTFSVIAACWFVSSKIIEPMLNKTMPIDSDCKIAHLENEKLSSQENKAYWGATLTFIFMALLLFVVSIPDDSVMRGANGSLTSADAALMKAIVPLVFLFLAIPGYVYGKISGSIKTSSDLSKMAASSLNTLTTFIVFCFVCGQFLYVFNTSNLSTLLAISGAEFLKSMNMPSVFTVLGVIIFTSFLNIFVTSATSKWAILSVIFVPMLMLLGISPELTQAAYRTSDSAVNVITPMFPFYPLVIGYCQKYYKKTGVGTLSSLMLPFGIALWIALVGSLFIFWALGLPLGFDTTYVYNFKG